MIEGVFEEEYKKLNYAQKDAVDTTEGPVMVIAGPGTGKTQVLALRIGNILKKTDTDASSILSLTFTNSGVRAMKNRLEKYIGSTANKVKIFTFHGFALELIEKYYDLLSFKTEPKLLDEDEAVFLVDDILQNNIWEHLSPRTNPSLYFNDLKQMISLLKREGLTPVLVEKDITEEIENLKNDPENISSRGETKGQLKQVIEKKIEALSRTLEVVEFYKKYEIKKKELGFIDYDDVLDLCVRLVEEYDEVRDSLREEYQYVLIDEHQDSSGVQNNFLKAVWQGVEEPNIFVVGDDRQLIYGFSGASISYFEDFAHIFGKAKLIVLTENYRSTENILNLADDLLQSSMVEHKLNSNTKIKNENSLNEYAYPRDEIIGAGLYFKQKIAEGFKEEDCALLVPKNFQVRSALSILSNLGLKVSSGKNLSLFELSESESLNRILQIIIEPFNSILLAESLLDKYSQIEPLVAHKFLKNTKPSKLTIEELISFGNEDGLFKGENAVSLWGNKLKNWIDTLSHEKLSVIVSTIGNELLIDASKNHEELIRNVEVVRSFIHTGILFEQKNKNAKLVNFLEYLNRLKSYGNSIDVATFGKESGVQVMTLHRSKGLEYKVVWIAHMNEETFMSEKKNGFTLPEKIKALNAKRSIETAKRELYVAITRAKEFCNISYARENHNGSEMDLAEIVKELPEVHFNKKNKNETEKEILLNGAKVYTSVAVKEENSSLEDIKLFVKENYADVKVSVTLLNNFFECPWKWYFRNFLKLPEVKGVSLALGSAVHSTIEFILKNKSLPGTKEIQNKIKIELEKEGVEDEMELKKLSKDGEFAVSYWVDNYYASLAKNHESERSLSFRDKNFPDLLMYGKIDLTERLENGDIIVTDFKTGSSKTKGVIEKIDEEGRLSTYLRQLAMYSYLVEGSEKKSVATSRLLFLESDIKDKNALYSTSVDREQIDLLLRDIADYDKFLKDGQWTNRICNYNSYGKHTECEYCKRAKIYK